MLIHAGKDCALSFHIFYPKRPWYSVKFSSEKILVYTDMKSLCIGRLNLSPSVMGINEQFSSASKNPSNNFSPVLQVQFETFWFKVIVQN